MAENDVTDVRRARALMVVLRQAEIFLKIEPGEDVTIGSRIRSVLSAALLGGLDERVYSALWAVREAP